MGEEISNSKKRFAGEVALNDKIRLSLIKKVNMS